MADDPVPKFRAWLIENMISDEAALTALESAIARELDAAVEFALSSPVPDLRELEIDVFAEEVHA
jgi:TPP-dependent pyruvate/acetoin dehydrogenase alpha subunit